MNKVNEFCKSLCTALDAYNAAYLSIADAFGFEHFDYDIVDMREYHWSIEPDMGEIWWWECDRDSIHPDSPQYSGELIPCSDGDDMTVSKCGGFGALAYDDGCGNRLFGIFDINKQIKVA